MLIARSRSCWPLPLMATLLLLLSVAPSSQALDTSQLEANIEHSYVDRGLVSSRTTQVGSMNVHYLFAGGPLDRVVLFCHGSSFSSHVWQIVGVMDALAVQGFTSIALDLPGHNSTSRLSGGIIPTTFVRHFAESVLEPGAQVLVVTASMGGSYGLPFALQPGSFRVAGYVTAAGNKEALGGAIRPSFPGLFIFGSYDPRLRSDAPAYHAAWPDNGGVVIMKDAPHPCYLRDDAAAREFTDLVLVFAGGHAVAESFESVRRLHHLAKWA